MPRTQLEIDKLSATLDIPSNQRSLVIENLENLVIGESLLTRIVNPYSDLRRSYRRAYALQLAPTQFLTIQVEPYSNAGSTARSGAPRRRFMRIEWNPWKANQGNPRAMALMLQIISRIIPDFSISMLQQCNITRIDFAFDVLGIPVDSFAISTTLRTSYSQRYVYAPNGAAESMNLGISSSDRYFTIYDKNREQESAQKEGFRRTPGRRRTASNRVQRPRTRVELRLKDVGLPSELYERSNPYTLYTLRLLRQASIALPQHQRLHFSDSIRQRGAQAALSAIENQRERTRYRDAIRALEPPAFWNPEVIWSEMPAAVRRAFGI